MPHPNRPIDILFSPTTLIAVVLAGEALAALLALSPAPMDDRLVLFGLLSLGIQWATLGTLAAAHALRPALGRLPPQTLAWVCLGMLLVMTLLVALVSWKLVSFRHAPGEQADTIFVLRALALALVAGLLVLLAFQNHWRARQLVLRAKQAELDALQARIHPHFLFNTLNTGAALVHQQPEKAEELLLDLADLFRAALTGSRRIPLREELELARRYLGIEQLRFGARMQVEWAVPETLPDLEVPILSIQPLVENAIHHGVEPSPGTCTLRIAIQPEGGGVRITVSNDLPPTPATAHRGHHVGLQALRARVQAMGGDVENGEVDGRYLATLVVPAP